MEVKQRTYKHWSYKEETRLVELKKKGLKYHEIAKKMNRSPLSVEKHYRKIRDLRNIS